MTPSSSFKTNQPIQSLYLGVKLQSGMHEGLNKHRTRKFPLLLGANFASRSSPFVGGGTGSGEPASPTQGSPAVAAGGNTEDDPLGTRPSRKVLQDCFKHNSLK